MEYDKKIYVNELILTVVMYHMSQIMRTELALFL